MESICRRFLSFLSEKGIIHKKSCLCTPQQNEIAERMYRHILETVWALLNPWFLCPSSVKLYIDVHLINRFSTLVLKISPHMNPFFVCLLHTHVFFYCLCFVHLLERGGKCFCTHVEQIPLENINKRIKSPI